MLKFIVKKNVHFIAVMIGISVLSFVLANIAPISPAEAYAHRITKAPTEEMIYKYSDQFGFNKPILEQYMLWLKKAVKLDFGKSYIADKPVAKTLLSLLPVSLRLTCIACMFILLIAIPLGVISAKNEGTLKDKAIIAFTFLSISVPSYFLGLLCLLIFGVQIKIMPVIGHGSLISMIFASFILAFPMIGSLCRILRTLLLESLGSPYVAYAKGRGISKKKVFWNHLLPNVAPPCIVMFGQNIGYLLAGTVIVESIFSTPGMGQYVLNAAINRDFPTINCYLVFMAICFVLFNSLAEFAGIKINPKLLRGENT